MNCVRWSYSRAAVLATIAVAVAVGNQAVRADTDHDHGDRARHKVTVNFGTGFNQPGALNHHVLPQTIKVRTQLATATTPAIPGVVNFIVSGLHQIFVYNPGVSAEDIQAFIAANDPTNANMFINDLANTFYQGFNPVRLVAGVPTYNDNIPTGPRVDRTDTMNRVESVGFTVPGVYLVICNVRPHFQEGMIAWIIVLADDDDDHGHPR
jgi:hypothetical protein